jgi:hypothetical protein
MTPEQQNALNIINHPSNVPKGLMDLDIGAVEQDAAKRRAITDAAAKKQADPVEALRAEYQDLGRRTSNGKSWSAAEATAYAEQQKAKNESTIKGISDEIAYLTELSENPAATRCVGLRQGAACSDKVTNACACDVHVFRRKIASLEISLRRAKNEAARSHRVCQGHVRQAEEIDKLKPRYFELHKQFSKIDQARQVARKLSSGKSGIQREGGMVRTPSGYMELPQPE